MMNFGLRVEFDGKRNVVLTANEKKEYPIGGLICDFSRLRPADLKWVIFNNPFYKDEYNKENAQSGLTWFYNELLDKYNVVVAEMVYYDFLRWFQKYLFLEKSVIDKMICEMNTNMQDDGLKEYILEDSGYTEFGISTVGQAMLSAYNKCSYEYMLFRYVFDTAIEEGDMCEEGVASIFGMYDADNKYQQYDFKILMYDGCFHPVYTIKSIMSLMLFDIAHIFDSNPNIVQCQNCGNYFVPVGRADSTYCGYPSPQNPNKTCRDIGAKLTREKKVKSDAVTQEFRRLYMRFKMGMRRHPEDEKIKADYENFTKGMKKLRQQREEGRVSSDDILEWLDTWDR